MTPLISVVTGTYNRQNSLVRMIDSARKEIPRGLSYEIIVVDADSVDGTIDWCADQPDIRLIQHGELKGAIRAFCDGAKAAQGQYVLLANDDIVFKPYSIIAALSHLERTPSCAAVAMADNRTSLVTGDGKQYRTEGIGATTATGEHTMRTYAQVGLFRRELGDQALWWGSDDPMMAGARTYGGDSYLSAKLYEMGYTVDPVPYAAVEDFILRDKLRDINAAGGPADSQHYYARFPTVHLPAQLKSVNKPDRLRIMCLPVYEQYHPGRMNREHGLTEALSSYGLAFELDYLNEDVDIVRAIKAWQPDLLVSQIQGPGRITPYMLASARNAAPNMMVINWCGDVYEAGLTSPAVLDMLRYVDLQLVVNAKVLPVYASLGIRAAYHQIYFKEALEPLPDMPAYELCLQANCYNVERDALVRTLREVRLSNARRPRLGLYGNCKGANGNTHYDFGKQAALYKNATINIGDTYPGAYAYVSNRLFQCLGNGGFMLQQHSPGLQEYTGLIPGEHFIEWSNLHDLKQKIVEWLAPERKVERERIAQSGMAFVRANYSADAQAHKLFVELLSILEDNHVRT